MFSGLACRRSGLRRSYIHISYFIQQRYLDRASQVVRNFSCRSASRQDDEVGAGTANQALETETSPIRRVVAPSRVLRPVNMPHATLDWSKWDTQFRRKETLHGYLTSNRQGSKNVYFVNLVDPQLRLRLQLVVDGGKIGASARRDICALNPHTPVAVTGQLVERKAQSSAPGRNITFEEAGTKRTDRETGPESRRSFQDDPYVGRVEAISSVEMLVSHITPLNQFPDSVVATASTVFPPEKRHLQMRTNPGFRDALYQRSKALAICRNFLSLREFTEIDTPILSKSTPEGAREFLVPTRTAGRAYALAQSPQQFKQILMASGIPKYYQFARCFRDEDLRADRQPEFTQLDMEMSFASSEDIMLLVERLIRLLWKVFRDPYPSRAQSRAPYNSTLGLSENIESRFFQMTYQEAMERWGSDKPDRRLGSMIHRVDDLLDSTLVSSISSSDQPVVEAVKVKVFAHPQKTKTFLADFLARNFRWQHNGGDHSDCRFAIYDPTVPMAGLSILADEETVKAMESRLQLMSGDLLVIGTRPNVPFHGQSFTTLGRLRKELHESLVGGKIVDAPRRSDVLWVTHFPLFSKIENPKDPGQRGEAGLKSTHHPFTAPLEDRDLISKPLKPESLIGDHFDLVINGVEIGGGSRRIHNRQLQENVLRDILKVPEKHITEFEPLLEALGSGCPPHVGVALGFDRLMTVLLQKETVRDVIAFPKIKHGRDAMMGSPAAVDTQTWKAYHLMPTTRREPGSMQKMDTESKATKRRTDSVAGNGSEGEEATNPPQAAAVVAARPKNIVLQRRRTKKQIFRKVIGTRGGRQVYKTMDLDAVEVRETATGEP